jgi:hypothetical protein
MTGLWVMSDKELLRFEVVQRGVRPAQQQAAPKVPSPLPSWSLLRERNHLETEIRNIEPAHFTGCASRCRSYLFC